jgi:hypothetical protein
VVDLHAARIIFQVLNEVDRAQVAPLFQSRWYSA